jgi:rRNA maturation protein Nop10
MPSMREGVLLTEEDRICQTCGHNAPEPVPDCEGCIPDGTNDHWNWIPKGEYPKCRPSCTVWAHISQLEESCKACDLRTKKAKDIPPFSIEDFFGDKEKK